MLIVHNHKPRLIDIPAPYLKAKDSEAVSHPFVVKLKPGANEVPPEQWDAVKDFGSVKALLAARELEVQTLKQPAFDEVPAEQALDLAGQTYDRELLRKWHAGETRSKVKLALEKQIEKITVKKTKIEE